MSKRTWMKLAAVAAAVVLVGAYVTVGTVSAKDVAQAEGDSLMQQKLHHAQSLLKALALEDYESIAKDARALHQISVQADWESVPNKDYGLYGDKFRDAASKVEKAAEESNLDSAAWQYMQVVVTCVECHKAVRGQVPAEVAQLQF